jgi:hypothetical protein
VPKNRGIEWPSEDIDRLDRESHSSRDSRDVIAQRELEKSNLNSCRKMQLIQSGKKVPDPPPILRFTTCDEAISFLFTNMLSSILNNPCKTAHPVVKDALHFIESELISDLRNRLVNVVARVEPAIFQEPLQHSK